MAEQASSGTGFRDGRIAAPQPPGTTFAHIVYFEPRIAGNTGSAIRLAAVTGARLHLVEPLGFDLSEAKLKRAGLDYHDLAVMTVHPSFDAAMSALAGHRVFAFEVTAATAYTDVAYEQGDVLVFGPEPTGLPPAVLEHPRITERVKLPMLPGRRSLNLTNAASIATYEVWRQLGFPGSLTSPLCAPALAARGWRRRPTAGLRSP